MALAATLAAFALATPGGSELLEASLDVVEVVLGVVQAVLDEAAELRAVPVDREAPAPGGDARPRGGVGELGRLCSSAAATSAGSASA